MKESFTIVLNILDVLADGKQVVSSEMYLYCAMARRYLRREGLNQMETGVSLPGKG